MKSAVQQLNNSSARQEELHRLLSLGSLSASLLHEISNPLTAALLYLSAQDHEPKAQLRNATRSIKQLERYVRAARLQASGQSSVRLFSIRTELGYITNLLGPVARVYRVGLRVQLPIQSCHLYGDPVKFQHIVSNVVKNSLQAYESSPGSVDRIVRINVSATKNQLTLTVHDRAGGIATAHVQQLFNGVFSTKYDRGNLGIGLSIVKRYIETDFGGSIHIHTKLGVGTSVIMKFSPAYFDKSGANTRPKTTPTSSQPK